MKNHLLLLLMMALACVDLKAQCGSSNYTEPQFTVNVQNPECRVIPEITVISASGGIAPYTYTLLPTNISNATGTFSNLLPGTYFVQMKDACGTIRTRQATIAPYSFTISVTMASLGCGKFQFDIKTTATSSNLQYGYIVGNRSDTVWAAGDQIIAQLAGPVTVHFVVKDECGNTATVDQFIPKEFGGYIKVLNERIMCNGQEIYPEYYGFDAPTVCLYTYPQRQKVECKQAPPGTYNGGALTNFFSLPFGQDYYVIVEDGCYRDSAFFRDKTSVGGSELNPFAWRCNTFDLHSDGNLTDSVCLYNSVTNQLVECKKSNAPGSGGINPNTGQTWPYGGAEFYNIPYGTYYTYIYDPCEDTLIRIDTTVRYPFHSSSKIHASCTIGESVIAVNYHPEAPQPWTTRIYWPNDSLVASYQSSGSNWIHPYPTYSGNGKIKVMTEDGCGKRDTSLIDQGFVIQPIRRKEVLGGCPGIMGNSGGGDIVLHGNAAAYSGNNFDLPRGTIRVIKKDGQSVSIPQSFTQFNGTTGEQDYYFTNLSTGTYILESSVGCNGYKVYDTVDIKPYVYPTQEQTHITQCGTNSFAFKDTVTGGVSPFTYEILHTVPHLSSLLGGPQSSNTFMIPPGATLDTIQIRVADFCGNAHIKEFPVDRIASCLPLEVNAEPNTDSIKNKNVIVYPNPSRQFFYIQLTKRVKSDYFLEIINSVGIKVLERKYMNIEVKTIEVRDKLASGTYFLNVIDLKSKTKYSFKQIIL